MVALNPAYLARLAGPGRLGFIATNGLHDTVVIDGAQENEYAARLREGWRVKDLRPICRSINPKLFHQHPDLVGARAYSYTLVILEHPDHPDAFQRPAAAPPPITTR
jgi:hypothetical protein